VLSRLNATTWVRCLREESRRLGSARSGRSSEAAAVRSMRILLCVANIPEAKPRNDERNPKCCRLCAV